MVELNSVELYAYLLDSCCMEVQLKNYHFAKILKKNIYIGRRHGLVVERRDSGARGRGFDPHSGRRVVSLSKIHLPPKKYW